MGTIPVRGGPPVPFTASSARARLLRAFLPVAPAIILVELLFYWVVGSNRSLQAALMTLLSAVVAAGVVCYAAHRVGRELVVLVDATERRHVEDASREGGDLTEHTRTEEQLRQAQKMEAVGRLAGGVAHDFNNSLGVILGYTELLLRTADEGQRSKLEQILKTTQRAASLTRQLLAFSRKQIVNPRALDLNALLSDVEQMLGRLIGEDIDLAIVPGPDLGQVVADAGQLEQVVMNLCVNARDAMPNGGLLRIETANAELDAGDFTPERTTPGRYVMLAVSDTGSGIPKDILSTIFEPFFTTKEPGKGTGLGLAMVYGTVKQAAGYVWVDSEVGRGTTFRIHLPRIDEPALAPAVEVAPVPSKGWETILLVEDEAPLRAIAHEILEEYGYRVIEAAGGDEAVALASHPEPIHLLLTDVVMPGMNGRELAEALRATRPALRTLYMSGYTDEVIAHRGVLEPGTLMIEKPFGTLALLGRVREALGEPGAGVNT
jgi:two-component system, cell cycle sensor histidine kinase and response regulator CckA